MEPGDASVGLCATCRFKRLVPGARSTFYFCERSVRDPRYPRYPPLPVIICEGYRLKSAAEPEPEPKHGKL